MEFIKTTELSKTLRTELLEIWNQEYPEKLNYNTPSDFDHYLDNLTEQSHILLSHEQQSIQGWCFDFIRDHKRWVAILLDSKIQRQGFGSQLLNMVKQKESELYAWVIDHNNYKKQNGEVYISPLNFYVKNGFEVLSKNRLEQESISAVQIKWGANPTIIDVK